MTFENVTDGQYFTPPNWAGHNRYASIFTRGDTASNGVQQLAENGAVDVLAAELTNNIDSANLGTNGIGTAPDPSDQAKPSASTSPPPNDGSPSPP